MLFMLCASLLMIVPSSSAANIDCADGTNDSDVITCFDPLYNFGFNTGLGEDTVHVSNSTLWMGFTDYTIENPGGNLNLIVDGNSVLYSDYTVQVFSMGNVTAVIKDNSIIDGASYNEFIRTQNASVHLTIQDNAMLGVMPFLSIGIQFNDYLGLFDNARVFGLIELGGGDDLMQIGGSPRYNGPIRAGDGFDTLELQADSSEERDQINAILAGKDPANDSIDFHGKQYRWEEFERIIATYTPPSSEGVEASPAILDNRINRTIWDVAAPVAVYQNGDVIDIYAINPNTDIGTLLIRLNIADLRDTQADNNPIELASAIIPSTGREVRVFLLPSGELQLNSTYYDLTDWKPYVIVWTLDNPAGLYHLDR